MQHDVGPGQQSGAPPGEQPGVARAGPDQVDGHGAARGGAGGEPLDGRPAPFEQGPRQRGPRPLGIVALDRHADQEAAVAAGHHARDAHAATVGRFRPRPHGQRAAPAQTGEHGALGPDGALAGLVVDGEQQRPRGRVVGAALHGDGALPGLGQQVDRIEDVGEPVAPAQPVHGRHRHHDGDALLLAHRHPPGHVAPQAGEDQVRPQVGQLGAAPGRAGGHQAAGRQAGQRAADQAVTGVGPQGHGRQGQVVRHGGGQVLGRVDRGVGPAVGHRRLHFGDEHALAADELERRLGQLVTARAHDDGLDLEPGVRRRQQVGYQLGLAQRQR